MTGLLIRRLAEMPVCEAHGEIVQVVVDPDGRVIDRGCYMAVAHYTVQFADGATKRYWMRGYRPVEISMSKGARTKHTMSKPIHLGTITPGGNAHLNTFVRRFSKRREAESVATAIRERGIECIARDRGVGAKPRYEVLVTRADFSNAYPAMITYLQRSAQQHPSE